MSDDKTLDFNFFDALQSGLLAIKDSTVDVLKTNAVLAVATGIAVALVYQVFVGDNMRLQLLIMIQQQDYVALLITFLFGIALNAAIFALTLVFATRTYMQMTGSASRGVGIKLGTNEPPLFQAAQEEVTVGTYGFLQFWRLWPILLIFPLFLITMSIIQEVAIARFQGQNVGGMRLLVFLFRLGIYAIYLWTFYRIIKFYFFLVPTVMDDGRNDTKHVKRRAPSGMLIQAIMTAPFWKYIFMALLIGVPASLYGWLFGLLMDAFDIQNRNFLGDLFYFVGRHFVYFIGAVFYVGALQVILKGTPMAQVSDTPSTPADA